MSREFKFRVWDSSINEYLQADQDNPYLYCKLGISYNLSDIMFFYARPKNNRWVVQQYTGFKDADGNEIYEGDILKNLTPTKYSDVNFTVEWGEFEPSDDMGVGGVGFVLPWFFTTFKPKVIGNIFENPELLK